jgi:transcriptional regulator with XRE-family HTH domain
MWVKDLLELLGKRVHEHRVARKWSQEEFAHVSGLHRTYIGQIERGEKNISFANLLKISGVLGVTMSELLAGLEDDTGAPAVSETSSSANRKAPSSNSTLKIKKILRQVRMQQAALDQSLAALEALAVPPGHTASKRPAANKRRSD